MSTRGVLAAAAAAVAAAALPVAAGAATPMPGATFTGTFGDGAGTVELRVSADASKVVAYRIPDIPGDTCRFYAEGDEGEWEAPIDATGAFSYRLYDAIRFSGRFSAPDAVTGTFHLHNDAVGAKPACDTGTVPWRATTAGPGTPGDPAAGGPAAADGGSAAAPGAPAGTTPVIRVGGSAAPARTFATKLATPRRASGRLTGRLTTTTAACRDHRTLRLTLGGTTVAKTATANGGRYTLRAPASLRGRTVRLSVAARTVAPGRCAAATSSAFRV